MKEVKKEIQKNRDREKKKQRKTERIIFFNMNSNYSLFQSHGYVTKKNAKKIIKK